MHPLQHRRKYKIKHAAPSSYIALCYRRAFDDERRLRALHAWVGPEAKCRWNEQKCMGEEDVNIWSLDNALYMLHI